LKLAKKGNVATTTQSDDADTTMCQGGNTPLNNVNKKGRKKKGKNKCGKRTIRIISGIPSDTEGIPKGVTNS